MGRRLSALAALIGQLTGAIVTVVALRGDGLRLVSAAALVLVIALTSFLLGEIPLEEPL